VTGYVSNRDGYDNVYGTFGREIQRDGLSANLGCEMLCPTV
jgi:hypothetical protein